MGADDGTGDAAALRVGVAAFGMAAQVFHVPLQRATPGLSLHAVASGRPDAAHAALPGARVYPDAVSLCRDPDLDLVVIPTPNHTHAPLAEAALRAGKHVVVDKPFALDAAEAERLRALAHETGRVLAVFHNRRWDGDFLTLRKVIRSGRIGRPVHLESHFDRFRPAVRDRWREQPGPGSGIWYDLGPHLVDQALQLFGLPRTVSADLVALRDGAEADRDNARGCRTPALRAARHGGLHLRPRPAGDSDERRPAAWWGGLGCWRAGRDSAHARGQGDRAAPAW